MSHYLHENVTKPQHPVRGATCLYLCKYFTTAAVREWTSSFSKIFLTWPCTVQALMLSSSAISLSTYPLLKQSRICFSRGVSRVSQGGGSAAGSASDAL